MRHLTVIHVFVQTPSVILAKRAKIHVVDWLTAITNLVRGVQATLAVQMDTR